MDALVSEYLISRKLPVKIVNAKQIARDKAWNFPLRLEGTSLRKVTDFDMIVRVYSHQNDAQRSAFRLREFLSDYDYEK